jgi:hypothetical protein
MPNLTSISEDQLQKGQILLIVVLVMVVILTVGLSVAARSITNIDTTTESENSQQAFSAAEAGIEKALNTASGTSGTLGNGAKYNTIVGAVNGNELLLDSTPILKDNSVDLLLSAYPTYTSNYSGYYTVYWGSNGDTCTASELTNTMSALIITVISGTKANPVVTTYPVDPCNARANSNKFEIVAKQNSTVSGKTFAYKKAINVASGIVTRITPLYAPTYIAVKGCDANNANCQQLPSQGKQITSTGTANNSQRKLVITVPYPVLPDELFPFVVFSPK